MCMGVQQAAAIRSSALEVRKSSVHGGRTQLSQRLYSSGADRSAREEPPRSTLAEQNSNLPAPHRL